MDLGSIISNVSQLGGVVVMALAILWVHRESLTALRAEMAMDREADAKKHESTLASGNEHHQAILRQMAADNTMLIKIITEGRHSTRDFHHEWKMELAKAQGRREAQIVRNEPEENDGD